MVGGLALALGLAYVVTCATVKRRSWQVRWRGKGHHVRLPSGPMALTQAVMSTVNWAVMGGVIWVLLRGQATYHEVLSVLLVAAVAGVLTHVPAGLGVLEGVFLALLGSRIPQGELLAALLGYRAIYYVTPLVLASLAYAATELRARYRGRRTVAPSGADVRGARRALAPTLSQGERG
jgi:uncharacterized membrane protein YbhN (UPF0104 family)